MQLRIHLIIGLFTCTALYFSCVHNRTCGGLLEHWRDSLEQTKPDVVLIGNSMLRAGVDEARLSELTQANTLKSFSNGSASAWWYLYVKNVLGPSQHKPKVAVIFFRDHYLTDPSFRTDGPYAEAIRTISNADEPVLRERIASPLTLWDSPLTWVPDRVKRYWDQRAMKAAARLLGISRSQQQRSMAATFDEERMIPEMLGATQLSSETCENMKDCDFRARVQASFLPLILQELQAMEIRPVFVRMKRRRDVTPTAEPPALKTYIAELRDYLELHEARLLDFTHLDQIAEAHYGPGDHLNPIGQQLFTEQLGKELVAEQAAVDNTAAY